MRSSSRTNRAYLVNSILAGILLILQIALGSPVQAQNYTACYLSFDQNPSGKNTAGCPSRIFLIVDSATYNFEIGPAADPNDPNLIDPNLCSSGIINPPLTDDAVRDLTEQFLLASTDLWVRPVGDTGLLIRRSKGPEDLLACGISTNDTSLKTRSLQVSLPALFIDVDHTTDLGDDNGMSGTSSVTVDINGNSTTVAVDSADSDQKVALKTVAALELDGYTVAYGGGTGLAVTRDVAGAVLTGSFTDGGNLSSQGVVPPLCFRLDSTSGRCGDPVTLRGAGIDLSTTILFGGVEATILNIMDLAEEQEVQVIPENQPEGSEIVTVSVESFPFDDCCPAPYTVRCASGINRMDILITKNGTPPMMTDFMQFFLLLDERPGPPARTEAAPDIFCSSGFINCNDMNSADLAIAFATGINITCPIPGITAYARSNVLSIVNNQDVTRVELHAFIAMEECNIPITRGPESRGAVLGYGLQPGLPINNVCSGICGDENLAPGAVGYNFTIMEGVDCFSGRVNAGSMAIEDVLFINGSAGGPARLVAVNVANSVTIDLISSSAGPTNNIPYVFWVWMGGPTNLFDANPFDIPAGIGRTVNPTPLHLGNFPQPFRCLRGGGLPAVVCGPVPGNGPAVAPFSVSVPGGFSQLLTVTMQAIIGDNGAANGTGFSTTNSVILEIEPG